MSAFYLYFVIMLGQIIFASTPLFIKVALNQFDPFTLGLVRFALASIILNLILLFKKQSLLPPKKHLKKLILLGFLGVPANQGLLNIGMQYTSPGHSALLYALTPILAYLVAIPLLKEKPRFRKFAGIFIALGGVIIVLFDRNISLEPEFITGDLIIFIGVWAWALYTVLGKKVVAELGGLRAVTYALTFGTLTFIPIAGYNTVLFDYKALSFTSTFSLLYLAIITTGIAYPLWYWALKYVQASRLTVFIFTQPVLTAIMSYIFLSEELTFNFVIGGIIVIFGVFLAERS